MSSRRLHVRSSFSDLYWEFVSIAMASNDRRGMNAAGVLCGLLLGVVPASHHRRVGFAAFAWKPTGSR